MKNVLRFISQFAKSYPPLTLGVLLLIFTATGWWGGAQILFWVIVGVIFILFYGFAIPNSIRNGEGVMAIVAGIFGLVLSYFVFRIMFLGF